MGNINDYAVHAGRLIERARAKGLAVEICIVERIHTVKLRHAATLALVVLAGMRDRNDCHASDR